MIKLQLGSQKNAPATYTTPGIKAFPTQHPYVKNKDGGESNVLIFGYQPKKDSPIYAIPSMVGGIKLSEPEAIKIAKGFGLEKYPQHKTPEEHNKWAQEFHGRINKKGVITDKPMSFNINELLNLFKKWARR